MRDDRAVAAIDGVTFVEVPFELRVSTPSDYLTVIGSYVWDGDGYTVTGRADRGIDRERTEHEAHYPRDVHYDEAVLRWCGAVLGLTLVRA